LSILIYIIYEPNYLLSGNPVHRIIKISHRCKPRITFKIPSRTYTCDIIAVYGIC
jgi:hypothetical protein